MKLKKLRGKQPKVPYSSMLQSAALGLCMVLPATAQQADSPTPASADGPAPSEGSVEEIVVTGTLVRGIAPPGTSIIGVTEAEVEASGATTTAQLLQTIPQFNSFNDLQFPTGAGNTVTVNRPQLRNLPNATSGGSTTLMLMDGHRTVGAGILSTTPDPDIVPPGAIERLEIVPDGGSAIYGADAVAGVINFITRRRFDGVEADSHYGFADGYSQFDVNLTAGRDWDSRGAYLSYNYAEHDALFGRDRDYARQFPNANGLTTIACGLGTVRVSTASSTYYALPYTAGGAVPNTANQCDNSDNVRFYPEEQRHSVFGAFSQDLSEAVALDVRAYYTRREIVMGGDAFGQTDVNVTSASPFFAEHRIANETSQRVSFQFGGDDAARQDLSLDVWGITPTLTAKLGGSWQLRLLGSYGESTTENHVGNFSQTGLTNAIARGLFNPYDPASSNPAALAAITHYETYGRAEQALSNLRAIVDGDLWTLPGGAMKLAAGVEYYEEAWDSRAGENVPGYEKSGFPGLAIGGAALIPAVPAPLHADLSRDVQSAFAELVVPIFGAGNARPGLQELTFSMAGRYDEYSDFGNTTNPKFGLTWKPTDWLRVRGSKGESFNAPSLADGADASLTTVFVLPSGYFPEGGNLQRNGGRYPDPQPGQFVYVVRGNAPGIQPQTAKTQSFGFDIEPTFAPSLNLSLTYYEIELEDVIQIPSAVNAQTVYGDSPNVVTVNPSPEELSAVAARGQVFPQGLPCHATGNPCSVYSIVDLRKSNLGKYNVDGLDLSASYVHDTGFGSLNFAINGNYELNREQQQTPSQPYTDLISSRYRIRTIIGAQIGKLLSQLVWNHTDGYNLDRPVGFDPQSKIDAFDVFNLYFRYAVSGEGRLLSDLTFTVHVDNVLDTDPPEYRGDRTRTPFDSGTTNGSTLGRLVQVGVSKRF